MMKMKRDYPLTMIAIIISIAMILELIKTDFSTLSGKDIFEMTLLVLMVLIIFIRFIKSFKNDDGKKVERGE